MRRARGSATLADGTNGGEEATRGGCGGGRSPPPRALGEHRMEGALIMSMHTWYILSLCIVGPSARGHLGYNKLEATTLKPQIV